MQPVTRNLQPESKLKILETPRDGMQGLHDFIPTKKKIDYINLLLKCGFDTVEVGSFVSPKAIPQLADTAEVLKKLDYKNLKSRIAVLAANKQGGKKALDFDVIDDLIFPFSVSETFLKKNINKNFPQAEKTVEYLQNLCVKNGKRLIPYLSMGFGNPYDDDWSVEILVKWAEKFLTMGIKVLPVSDIMGDATPQRIGETFSVLITEFPDIEFGLHLHSLPETATEKVEAAYKAGIRRFDTVLGGMGGCPMTGKEMVSNLALETLISYCEQQNIPLNIDRNYLKKAAKFIL